MKAFAFLLLVCAFAFFGVATAVLLYHFRNFRLHKEHHRLMAGIFVVGSVLFLCAELYLFAAVDWSLLTEYVSAFNRQIEQ